MAKIFSCKGCKERHGGCHATCERYAAEKAEHERERAEQRSNYQKDLAIMDAIIQGKQRRKKR